MDISIHKNHKTLCVNDETLQRNVVFLKLRLLLISIHFDTNDIGTNTDTDTSIGTSLVTIYVWVITAFVQYDNKLLKYNIILVIP